MRRWHNSIGGVGQGTKPETGASSSIASVKGNPKGTLKGTGLKEDIKNNSNTSFTDLNPELHIDEKRASEYLGVSPRTLQGYRTKGGDPEFIKISHKVVRYKIVDLIKWTETRKRKNTSE